VAGFIGSHLLHRLLLLGQNVIGLDNFSTGSRRNLEEVQGLLPAGAWARFRLVSGDLRVFRTCQLACRGVDFVLHQAALGSVPRSLRQPRRYLANNVGGFLNLIQAAREAGVARFVYASSSSVYGDSPILPRIEHSLGQPLSPYALTKVMNETCASLYASAYGFPSIGLRYFNVFGPRQNPAGAYAAVIPKWVEALLNGRPVQIHGDGESSRDFCYVENVAEANVLAATVTEPLALNQVYNIAVGARTSLNELFALLKSKLQITHPAVAARQPVYHPVREADVRHSLANVGKARRLLGYSACYDVGQGLDLTLGWYQRYAQTPRARVVSRAALVSSRS